MYAFSKGIAMGFSLTMVLASTRKLKISGSLVRCCQDNGFEDNVKLILRDLLDRGGTAIEVKALIGFQLAAGVLFMYSPLMEMYRFIGEPANELVIVIVTVIITEVELPPVETRVSTLLIVKLSSKVSNSILTPIHI